IQANAILEMQLRRLVGIERAKLQAEAKELKSQITDLRDLLNREERRLALVVAETEEVAQLSAPRRTTIVDDPAGATVTVTESDLLIPDQPQTLIINTSGGIYRGSHTPGLIKALAPGKAKRGPAPWLALLEIAPESLVVALSKQGQIWYGPAWRVPEKGKVSDLGLAEMIQLCSLPDLAGHYLLAITAAGKVKRTALADLGLSEGQTSSFIKLAQGDRVVASGLTAGQGQVVLTATTGKTIRFSEEAVNPQISGSGVAAMNLGAEGRVIG
ncbi:MAG: hypothetical protein GY797_39450, partial [Deltaproteobacteria bacterium]|nr:hypothetical protein [Deltaproteobacteria bacterium]